MRYETIGAKMIQESQFRPAWWLPSPHHQTIWPHLFRRIQPPTYRIERLQLDDGDFIDLAWNTVATGPINIIFHGLEGSIRSPYAAGLMQELTRREERAVLMHFRGCSGTPNRLARGYHSGDTGDINALINTLRQREPNTPIRAVGFSLGGNALLKYLGESGSSCQVERSVAISVPFVLSEAAKRLSTGLSRVYQTHLLMALKATTRSKAELLKLSGVDLKLALASKTFWDFDDLVTAPLHGFEDVHDYYHQCSSLGFLKSIARPTLILQARDDPFMTASAIPDEDHLSHHVCLELSQKGGHVGFVSGDLPGAAQYWLDNRIASFLSGTHP